MIIFVDGFQNTGKTSLIENCGYKHNRFPFNQYLDKYQLNENKERLNGYQLGKDLGILFGLQYTDKNLVFDRGPFSTIFYSLKEKRYGENTNDIVAYFLQDLREYKEKCKYIFVIKCNDKGNNERIHNDGFDYLNDDNDPNKEKILQIMLLGARIARLDIRIFINDFSKPLEENQKEFNKLLEEMMNEHNGN